MSIGHVTLKERNRIDPESALDSLNKLIDRHLGTSISPDDLRKFLINHWSKISPLAHAVHDKGF